MGVLAKRRVALVVVASAACGSSPSTTVLPTSTAVPPTTVAPSTTAASTAARPATTVVPPTTVVPAAPDNERFGALATGLVAAEVETLLGPAESKQAPRYQGATGTWVSTWAWPTQGVTLLMSAREQGAPSSVASITITAPSDLRTSRGIGIGATHSAVEAAYHDELVKPRDPRDPQPENTPERIVIGSIYGGTIFFFDNGVVRKMFVGAAAE